jgi:hypothetical protein
MTGAQYCAQVLVEMGSYKLIAWAGIEL